MYLDMYIASYVFEDLRVFDYLSLHVNILVQWLAMDRIPEFT